MQIHISESFSKLELVNLPDGTVIARCPLWPTWDDLVALCKDTVSDDQMMKIFRIWRSESEARKFTVDDGVLIMHLA